MVWLMVYKQSFKIGLKEYKKKKNGKKYFEILLKKLHSLIYIMTIYSRSI